MPEEALLVLEDGSFYKGIAFGALSPTYGEVVFNTSMTGYQEMLTDPSYAGQIVMPTYPIIGNYGINGEDVESSNIKVSGFVVREHATRPSHNLSQMTLAEYLSSQGIMGIAGVDTRAITRRLRSNGVMMGMITLETSPEAAFTEIKNIPKYGTTDLVSAISTNHNYLWGDDSNTGPLILVSDYGVKYNIMRLLTSMGCRVMAIPSQTSAKDILSLNPDGLIMSPGPGDPALLDFQAITAKTLIDEIPIMGICLGHQILARAMGAETFKLKFGHRGGNHPVQSALTGKVYITAQNHGYAVVADSLPADLEITHTNLNDGTIEGLKHRHKPVMSIQYHTEASPGPMDNVYLFSTFLDMVKSHIRGIR